MSFLRLITGGGRGIRTPKTQSETKKIWRREGDSNNHTPAPCLKSMKSAIFTNTGADFLRSLYAIAYGIIMPCGKTNQGKSVTKKIHSSESGWTTLPAAGARPFMVMESLRNFERQLEPSEDTQVNSLASGGMYARARISIFEEDENHADSLPVRA